ncbi:unnamed protein product [Gongylonema pulchrum]|uniref:HMG box domain-containing protein n=1 Tax=Gongylonema pulchrum TaxID=637853 RepID=A0A183DTA5_9BILA|nr:unnamed protein product [Gongylonema pulchrum]
MDMTSSGGFVADALSSSGPSMCAPAPAPAPQQEAAAPAASNSNTSSSSQAKKSKKGSRARTGYMLFHGEARKRIRAAHPELNFVEVSKRVGEEVIFCPHLSFL